MSTRTDDLRIRHSQPLLAPAILSNELPLSANSAQLIAKSRTTIENILSGKDKRLLVMVGPCSIHDPAAAMDYARQLKAASEQYSDKLFIVLRVYFEKPRTVVGWKGLINDPDLDGSFQINKGLKIARQLLLDVAELGLPAASEFLDTTIGQYYADLVSFAAIGARTVESQVHRELASGLSMPVGFKNRTDGDMQVAVDAIRSASHPHWFPSLTKEGSPAILATSGNPHCYMILRGGNVSGPNYDAKAVSDAKSALQAGGLTPNLVIDCSHGNSLKKPENQPLVAEAIAEQMQNGESAIRGVMLESHLVAGNQKQVDGQPLMYGQSITDGCLSLSDTLPVLEKLAAAVR
ncbi:3-deoxy-7-phosphoheptulonate synthase [Porticoccus sp. W117]|uniref:3-deoxy-7-phosphoheptulonate synthase n=1 Tax=Porticoccus sp. W117 TaxID=3054777 RepID=UPI002594E1F7|nr:3-deoxy-7-phosphoheptulonate synthase [Porticoccus sp. W117]MDM3872436.1 3-deoxy-7-phosphoheptulonate synthase [Porticoccus sp. W117]